MTFPANADIYQFAHILLRKHGNEADLLAAELANSFLEAGEIDGSAVWKRVLAAVKEIQRQGAGEGEAIN